MSDNNYSIDDILAEIDAKRSKRSSEGSDNVSVTEIIGGNEIEKAMSAAGIKRRKGEQQAAERKIQQEADRRADMMQAQAQASETAEEGDSREKKQRKFAEKHRKPAKEKNAPAETAEEPQPPVQAASAADADDLRELFEHTGYTAELSTVEQASGIFAEEEPEAHVQPFVKPEVSGDSEVIFQTQAELVPTATQQLRKQQRIEEINRALLRADKEAESNDELLDSINPMDSRAKAAEAVKSAENAPEDDIGDTLAVAGNDLKRLASGEEHVKEYSPALTRKKSEEPAPVKRRSAAKVDSVLSGSAESARREKRGSDALVESLNKQIEAQRASAAENEQTVTLSDISQGAHAANIPLNIADKQIVDTAVLKRAEEDDLASRKKRKISEFVLQDIDAEVESAGEEEEEDEFDEDEPIDLDDENVISDRLNRSAKGLLSRVFILSALCAVTLFVAIVNQFDLDVGFINGIISRRVSVEYHLYTYLTIGILSFMACSSVVLSGFSRLIRLKPDGDTLCTFSHIGALLAIVMYLAQPEYIQLGKAHVYLLVSLFALLFNTISKLFTVRAAQNNFRFISGDNNKYFVESFRGMEAAVQGTGIPHVASMRKTEMLCDFLVSTYCEDSSDRIARKAAPAALGAAVVGGLAAFFLGESEYVLNNAAWGFTVASAILAIGAAFSGSMIVMLPMLSASKVMARRNACILGCSAVDDFSTTDEVLVDAKALFPANSVTITTIWEYNKNGKKGSQKVMFDEAIIYAASLSIHADSILSNAFFDMLSFKKALLKKVSNCVYESNMGVTGWIGNRRVMLGNREHMKSHGITVPDMKTEQSVNKEGDEVVYLAVSGEVCMLFFVAVSANIQVKEEVQRLNENGVGLIVKTVDGLLTPAVIAGLFDIPLNSVHVIPFEMHEEFDNHTKYASKGSAAVSCDGTFSSLAAAINGTKNLRQKIMIGCIMQIAGIALGILLGLIFALFKNYSMFNAFVILGYNILWTILTLGVQAFKRI